MPAELQSTPYSRPEEAVPLTPKQESSRPWIVAVLLVGGFALALMSFIELMLVSDEIGDIYPAIDLSGFLTCCGVIVLVAAISCLVGAVFSYKRSRHSLVVVAAAVGMLGVGPLYLGSLLSLIAMIIAAVSRSDYKN